MKFLYLFFLIGLFSLDALPSQAVPGFTTTELSWTDPARQREVPVKIYAPKDNQIHPVIIFSHGLGGSREGYAYLGEYWSEHGYISVHVQHLGSDDAVWKDGGGMTAMRRAATNPANVINRPKDISFAIDQLTQLNQVAGPWKGRFDLNRIGVAGHSFGAYTAMAIAGESFAVPLMGNVNLGDPRVKAVIAMSSPVPRSPTEYAHAYASVQIPVFHMTGTIDQSPIGDTTPAQRRIPYDYTKYPETYLLTFTGGDHMVFSGRGLLTRPSDREFERLVQIGSTAFWDAYLRGDQARKDWLVNGGFSQELGSKGTFEKKGQ